MVIHKKLLRGGLSNNLRFIGSILIIAICVCMYTSFASSMWSLFYELGDYREECNLHDYLLSVSNEIANEEELSEKYGIELESRSYCEIKREDGDIIRLMSANEKVDKYVVREGEDISSDDDILIDKQYAEKNSCSIGSDFELNGKTYKVKGYYTEPDFTLITNSIKGISINHESYGIAIASKAAVSSLPQAAVEYLISCNGEEFARDDFLKDVYASAMVEKLVAKESDNRATYIDSDLKIYTKGMQIIPFFFLIVASFVVAIILSKLMKAETVQIGVFYALGYRPIDLYKHYISYAVVISVCGGLLGIGSGILLAPVLRTLVTERYSVPPFQISLELKTVAVSLLIPFGFLVVLCSFFIISKLMKSPLVLLRNQTTEKSGFAFRGLEMKRMSFTTRFRSREILRNIGKYVFMVFGVSVSAVMLLLFASVLGSLNKMMDDTFSKIVNYEYMYTYADMTAGKPDGYRTNLNYLLLDGEEISVNGIDINNAHMKFEDTDGNPVTFEDHVITINLAQKFDIHAGDTVTLKSRYSDDEYNIKIDRVIVSYAEDFIALPLDEFNEYFGYPEDSYIIVTADHELDIDPDLLLSVNSKKNSRESIDETLKPVRYLMISMMIMAAFVSFILMVIIISIILEDSRFTISLMKILGYSDKRISKLLIDFNRYVVIIAFVVSIPLILKSSSKIMGYLSEMMGMHIPTYLNPVHAAIGFALLYVVFIAVKLIMKRKILAIDPAETLKSGE